MDKNIIKGTTEARNTIENESKKKLIVLGLKFHKKTNTHIIRKQEKPHRFPFPTQPIHMSIYIGITKLKQTNSLT